MSIIAEALKKAQESLQKTSHIKKPSIKRPGSKTKQTKKRSSSFYVYAGIALVVLAFFSAGLLVYVLRQNPIGKDFRRERVQKDNSLISEGKAESPSYVLEPAVNKEENLPPVAASPITPDEVNKAIRLTGIMYAGEKPLAVINGNIWGEGDYIGKFKISKIEKNFIKAASNGQEFVIRLKR